MTFPLSSSNFPWFLLSFAITFISFFIAFDSYIPQKLLELIAALFSILSFEKGEIKQKKPK